MKGIRIFHYHLSCHLISWKQATLLMVQFWMHLRLSDMFKGIWKQESKMVNANSNSSLESHFKFSFSIRWHCCVLTFYCISIFVLMPTLVWLFILCLSNEFVNCWIHNYLFGIINRYVANEWFSNSTNEGGDPCLLIQWDWVECNLSLPPRIT